MTIFWHARPFSSLVTLAGRGGSTHHSRDPSGLSAIIAAYLEQVNEHGGRDEMIY
jgi:hypothetical protein